MIKYSSVKPNIVRTGLFAGVAGVALFAYQPVAAQEACTPDFVNGFVCDSPDGDTDVDLGLIDVGGAGDGFYDNLDEKIDELTPTEAEAAAQQAILDAANVAADDAAAANDAVQASLTDDNIAAFEAVEAAEASLTDAAAAQASASDLNDAAQTAFDTASDNLTAANIAVADAQADLTGAQAGVDAAQTAFDADQSQANLDTLNAALATRGTAQANLDTAEADRTDALATANDASAVLADAQTALTDADAVLADATTGLADAETALGTSLATNADFVTAITAAGETADVAGITAVADAVDTTSANLAVVQAETDAQDDNVNTLARARDVLVPAAENGNAAIASAAQAYLGDPRAAETNAEVEVVAALVDHEARITTNRTDIDTNTANIAVNRTDIDSNMVNIALNRTDIDSNTANISLNRADIDLNTADIALNSQAIVDERNSRIAADAAMQSEINAIGSRVTGIETRLEQLDQRISSATATAIALGGLSFMPNTDFNLAMSAGFYDGEQAIAASFGARVSNNVAITAGVGTGFGDDSEIGGRVGVIFGW